MMKKTLLTIAATTGLAVGGFSLAGVASAQSYGDDSSTQTPVVEDAEDAGAEAPEIVLTQTEGDEAPADAETNEEGRRRGHRRGGCGDLETAAEAIGIEEDALRESLESGQSIADVATANDVDPQTVVDAMVASATERLSQKVEDGRLTQEEADERLAEKSERISDRVSGTQEVEDEAA